MSKEEPTVNPVSITVEKPPRLKKKDLKRLKGASGQVPVPLPGDTVSLMARECLRYRKLKKRLSELQGLCDELEDYVLSDEFLSDGLSKRELYISEAAITACLGKGIWAEINGKLE